MFKKNLLLIFTFFFFGFTLVFAVNNFFPIGNNWDANVSNSSSVNDQWSLNGRINLEDSLSSNYSLGNRGSIVGTIDSELFGLFDISTELSLDFKSNTIIPTECGDSLEVYYISGNVSSEFWGPMTIASNSFFCSNQFVYIKFTSDTLGDKEIGNINQSDLVDNFDKQKISISGIAKIKGDEDSILNREDNPINDVYIDSNKKLISKSIIEKNITKYTKGLIPDSINDFISADFNNLGLDEKIYYYDFSGQTETISFEGDDYINEGKNLTIGYTSDNKIGITGKNTVIAKSANIYITDDLYNTNDNKSLLVLVAKRDEETGNGGNIYIDPSVTNIDAILIADGSIISMSSGEIQYIGGGYINNLRKQLLIFGSIISSNNIGSDTLVYGADLYEDSSVVNNEMIYNIYDLVNLRTFNLNYGEFGTNCTDENELAPIDGSGNYIIGAWAGRKNCYLSDTKDPDLRGSDKSNPIVVDYNPNIQLLNPVILKND